MTDLENAPAGIGHNAPPEPTAIDTAMGLVNAANRWIIERPKIEDEEQATKLTDFINQLRAGTTALDAALKAEEKPHKAAIAAIVKRYSDPKKLMEYALGKVRP